MPYDPNHSDPDPIIERPSLSIDWECYAAMLEDSDMPLDQQKELIETLWSIVVMFVDLGFDVHPTRQICGEADDPLSDDPPDLLSLMEDDWITDDFNHHQQQEDIRWQP